MISLGLRLEAGQQKSGRAKKTVMVSGMFVQQILTLMDKIGESNPHFARCIKPNPSNLALQLVNVPVLEQLRYGGVLLGS